MKLKSTIAMLALLCVGLIIYISTPKNNSSINVKENQRHAAEVSIRYLQMYNTVCTKENYGKYVEEFKSMCTEEYYYRTYVQSNIAQGGLSEDTNGYNLSIEATVCEINEADNGYRTMIYEIETYNKYKYPYTVIVDLTADYKVRDFQKISHRFN